MIEHFCHDEDAYKWWVRVNRRGFVAHPNSRSKFTVHTARCDHIAWFGSRNVPKEEWVYTNDLGKWCSEALSELMQFLEGRGGAVKKCSDCAPVNHVVGPPPVEKAPAGMACLGSSVTVKDVGGLLETVQLTPSGAADDDHSLSVDAPMGRALLGTRSGDTVTVVGPGATYELTVTAVEDP